jgi:hypothetical protein
MLLPFTSKPQDPQPQPPMATPTRSVERPMDKTKRKSKPHRYDNVFRGNFGPYAPPVDLPFPAVANITAYELLAFLPHSLHSVDVVYRFISNGGTRHVLWVMVNVARDMPQEWNANRCGTIMYKAMEDAGFHGWTVTIHDKWHESRKADWDEAILNVTGYRTPAQMRGHAVAEEGGILFRSLATGVRRMPQGDDALDLTRMVQYCVQHPEEPWMYPQHYEALYRRIGGAAQIRKEHIDRAAFKRWEGKTAPPPRAWSVEEKEAAIRLMESGLKGNNSVRTEREASERQPRRSTPLSETQDNATEHRARGRPRKRVRLEEIEIEDEEADIWGGSTHVEQYTRAPAEYVAPPGDAVPSPAAAIRLAFAAEHDVGETDPFTTYAFGGPRYQPPYRMLHDIQQPHKADVSGWAENLRWAWEQRACFWHAAETEGWNESPAHMELIAQTRQKQVWASDELLELLPDAEN